MAIDVLRRAKIAAQAFFDIDNWRDVLPRAARGQPVTEIHLRKGQTISATPAVALWPHFSDIWYHRSYTKHCSIPAESVVVDIGANVGVFALLAARTARLVYALEPSSSNFSSLVSNTSQSSNIIPFNVACAAFDGKASLDLTKDPVSYSLRTNRASSQQEMVDVVRLETFLHRSGIDHCDFLKLDCEGCEFEIILETDPSVFKRISKIVLEYHDHLSQRFSHRDLVQKLTALDFRTVVYNPNGTHGMIAGIR